MITSFFKEWIKDKNFKWGVHWIWCLSNKKITIVWSWVFPQKINWGLGWKWVLPKNEFKLVSWVKFGTSQKKLTWGGWVKLGPSPKNITVELAEGGSLAKINFNWWVGWSWVLPTKMKYLRVGWGVVLPRMKLELGSWVGVGFSIKKISTGVLSEKFYVAFFENINHKK